MKYFDIINIITGEKIATTRTPEAASVIIVDSSNSVNTEEAIEEAANDIINEAHPNGVDVYGANYQAATLLKLADPIRYRSEIDYIKEEIKSNIIEQIKGLEIGDTVEMYNIRIEIVDEFDYYDF